MPAGGGTGQPVPVIGQQQAPKLPHAVHRRGHQPQGTRMPAPPLGGRRLEGKRNGTGPVVQGSWYTAICTGPLVHGHWCRAPCSTSTRHQMARAADNERQLAMCSVGLHVGVWPVVATGSMPRRRVMALGERVRHMCWRPVG
eukprot:362534-Chlamydomonas_euryale.AAC.8